MLGQGFEALNTNVTQRVNGEVTGRVKGKKGTINSQGYTKGKRRGIRFIVQFFKKLFLFASFYTNLIRVSSSIHCDSIKNRQ